MVGTNSYVAKLKEQLDQAIIQREHWKQLAENRNSIVVTEVCPESRSVEEYIIDADSVRSSWRLIRRYREQAEALRAENAKLRTALAEQGERQEASPDVRGLVEAGNPLSNVAYNLAQKPGHALTEFDCELLSKLRKRWDEAVLAHRLAQRQA